MQAKQNLNPGSPNGEKRAVAPGRLPNTVYRKREHLTPAEVAKLIDTASASARVTRTVKAINRVGALASVQYEKTPAQVDKIESYLNAAVRAAVARLRGEAEADTSIEI